jgi:hypothetical protein
LIDSFVAGVILPQTPGGRLTRAIGRHTRLIAGARSANDEVAANGCKGFSITTGEETVDEGR